MRLTGLPPPTSQAVRSVLSVIRTNEPIHTRDIYKRVTEPSAPSSSSSSSTEATSAVEESPVKSMKFVRFQSCILERECAKGNILLNLRYLKHTVLRYLEARQRIEKFHQKVTLTEDERYARLGRIQGTGKKKNIKLSGPEEVSVWKWRMKKKETVEPKGMKDVRESSFGPDPPLAEKTTVKS